MCLILYTQYLAMIYNGNNLKNHIYGYMYESLSYTQEMNTTTLYTNCNSIIF